MNIKSDTKAIKKLIIDGLDLSGYDIEPKFCNITYTGDLHADLEAVHNIFKSEYVHSGNKNQSEYELFSEWLQGLPSCVNIPFYYADIIEVGKQTGIIRSDYSTQAGQDSAENKYCGKWFYRVAVCYFQLLNMGEKAEKTILNYCKDSK